MGRQSGPGVWIRSNGQSAMCLCAIITSRLRSLQSGVGGPSPARHRTEEARLLWDSCSFLPPAPSWGSPPAFGNCSL